MKVRSKVEVRGPNPVAQSAPPATTQAVKRPELLRAPGLEALAQGLAGPSEGGARVTFRRLRLDHLTSGKRFDVRTTKALTELTGQPLSLDGLARMYDKALPSSGILAGTRVRVTGTLQKDHFAYTVTFVDNMQRRIATARRRLVRHEDGALELYRHGTWVDEDQRGRGFAAHVLRQEVGLVTALSDHPNTRLTLWAGGARNPSRGGDVQSVGVYLWAKAGFEVAEAPSSLALGKDKPRCEDDPGREVLDDLSLMKRQLVSWLEAQVEAGALTPEQAAEARRAAETAGSPADIAALELEGVRLETKVGEGPRAAGLGKAFLLSAHSPRWEGALYVNRGETPAMQRAEAFARTALDAVGLAEQAQGQAWAADLSSGDPEREQRALEQIGRRGGARLVPMLVELREARPDLDGSLKDVLLKVRGRYEPPRPKVTYSAHGGRAQAFSLPQQFADLARLSVAKLAVVAVEDEDPRRAQAALQQLADKHLTKSPKVVLEAAKKAYTRYLGDDDRWLARKTAVEILAKLPDEAGIEALVEASKVEDEINVMIAVQRVIDNAEHPAAVEPAERLGERIEQMKAEIDKALAEL